MVMIACRFCGPPESGNGGYSAGLLAKVLGGAVEVTLRKPPPLERELTVVTRAQHAELRDGTELIAEARSAELDLPCPKPPSFEGATLRARHYVGYERHHFPGCFVCGPARAPGDGLRIFPGSSAAGEPVAAPWVPEASVADETGQVPVEIAWAALDCIGYFAVAAPDYPVALLGRMTGEVLGAFTAGTRYVVLGWALSREGRKLQAGTALFDEGGSLLARARQTWLTLPNTGPTRSPSP